MSGPSQKRRVERRPITSDRHLNSGHSQRPLACLKRADIVAKVFLRGGTQIL
jgi:hypothetical protein